MGITKEELAKAQGCSVEEINDDDVALYDEEQKISEGLPPEDVDEDIEVDVEVKDDKTDKKDESETDDDTEIKSETEKVVTDDTDASTETKDDELPELPDEFKDRYVLKETYEGGDPIGDENHPLHQIAIENSKATRLAITAKRQAETERDDAKAALLNIDVDSENNPKTGVYGGMTLEQARDEDTEHKWHDARDNYRAVIREKARQKDAQAVADKEYETRETEFFTVNPDLNKDEFLERHRGHSFEQCQTLDEVKSGGGIEAMLKKAREEGFTEGAKKGSSDTLSAVSENTTKADEIKASDGASKNTSSKGEFKLKSATEMSSMTDKQWEEYDAEVRKAEETGKISKIGGYGNQ